ARKKHIIEVRAELARKGGETFKRLHEDPNFRSAHSKRCSERMSKTKTDVAYEEKRIKACKKKFADPVFREKNSQERREQMFLQRQDPGFLVANRIGLEKCWASTSEYRVENARRHFQRLWQDPDFRERKRQKDVRKFSSAISGSLARSRLS
ncbi:MAG: hypothetical protein NT041_00330, partial [Candidatus Vogelbacteria bacterium]|nr:hypothetical protein [Candidatus Vogelbacteria bacterium]